MLQLTKYADAPARAMMAAIFVLSGLGKLGAVAAIQGYMAMFGVPPIFIWSTVALEIGGGLLLLIGLWTRPVALLLVGFCLVSAAVFHTAIADQTEMMMFLKNVAMAGGLLLLAKDGAPRFSVGALLSRWQEARS